MKNFPNFEVSDSDSSDCSDTEDLNYTPVKKPNKPTVAELLKSLPTQNMTSFETMAAQLATMASLNGFPALYPGMLSTHPKI